MLLCSTQTQKKIADYDEDSADSAKTEVNRLLLSRIEHTIINLLLLYILPIDEIQNLGGKLRERY